jgi:hypothetical protein
VIFVEGTPEDPAAGGHEAFLSEIIPIADMCEVQRSNGSPARPALRSSQPSAAASPAGSGQLPICVVCKLPVSRKKLIESQNGPSHQSCVAGVAAGSSLQTVSPSSSANAERVDFPNCGACGRPVGRILGVFDAEGRGWHPNCPHPPQAVRTVVQQLDEGPRSSTRLAPNPPQCAVCQRPVPERERIRIQHAVYHASCRRWDVVAPAAPSRQPTSRWDVRPARSRGALPQSPVDPGYWD